tara:strand:- start:269 stop:490 length:222 start_codon:yes stop_codon:yes gene_type:complete
MNYIKVKGHSNLARTGIYGSIVNINKEEIAASRKRKLERKQKEKDFEDLKNEVGDIKNMLNKIIEKLDGSNTN